MAVNQLNNLSSFNYTQNSYTQNPINNTKIKQTTDSDFDASKDAFCKKNNMDGDTISFSKGSDYSRGLKVLDKEIQDCKREDFESDEAYTNHMKMLLEARQGHVGTEAEAKAKKTEARTEGASKIIDSTGNLLGKAADFVGSIAPFFVPGA